MLLLKGAKRLLVGGGERMSKVSLGQELMKEETRMTSTNRTETIRWMVDLTINQTKQYQTPTPPMCCVTKHRGSKFHGG